jgi:hypothetical protein
VVEGGERVQRVEADVEGAVDLGRGVVKLHINVKSVDSKN